MKPPRFRSKYDDCDEAAELARLLHHEGITESMDRDIYKIIQRLTSAGLDR